ncbi:pseudouridine synthase [Hymenobacter latericus]|uniref:pseudouridine synthase n=1 Tax=Hymenobacter sp. YIM 151858-1 TaxID=2987688 RepID=UPI002226FF48|nr:pseudouridine synthase [Hymenobacter sp. YIM 151858-1]UYZ58406.1 pseudouridine synthase [Hymenobacter sp. YIM 151858-1]
MGKKQQSFGGPGNRRPGRPGSDNNRGDKPFNSYGDDRRSGGAPRRPEGGNDFPSRPPFGRPAGKPGFGNGPDRRFSRPAGEERRFERPRYNKPAEPDGAADFMRGRLNKPDFRGDERTERPNNDERGPRRSFDRRPEGNDRPRRSFGNERGGYGSERGGNDRSGFGARGGSNERGGFGARGGNFGGESRFGRDERPARRFERDGDAPRPSRGNRGPSNDEPRFERGPARRFDRDEQRPERPERRFDNREERSGAGRFGRPADDKPRFGGTGRFERPQREERPSRGERPERFNREERPSFDRKPRAPRENRYDRTNDEQQEAPAYKNLKFYEEDKTRGNKRRREEAEGDETVRLNRYIANAGICSRREADQLIEAGEIRVNGEVVTELGYKVKPSDTVHYGKTNLKREKLVYVLLNKPKDFLTTTEDPEGRKTVMDLVKNASKERIFPVGRLDRNTTGLLLFTNDGEVAQKLSHPSHRNKKVYQVELDKELTDEHLAQIAAGLELEDGKAEVDDVAVVAGNRYFVGVEIHIGRNRIVRRIFEHLGYDVKSLDRVQYAGLTKKDLPRGNWRYLTEKEVIRLKYFM